ncbi:D-alanyl-D-alanine carboxypeptidase/D-alanyl-D-alanine endopeptidase [Carbonactinospora thermoautotrophica]|uniref:D-alanyl-D-alanine carboxypeptidase/D-alanyl-D-alanine endopeptidase n=1 Tax=Carbonactinospora thermoautotrophica TaxID=1469144 RepID=UPI003DA88033
MASKRLTGLMGGCLAIAVLIAAVALTDDRGRSAASPPSQPDVAPAVAVLAPQGSTDPVPSTAGLARVLGPLMREPALGGRVAAAVVDPLTGRLLYGEAQDQPMTPASSAKVLTAVAALRVLGPDRTLPTRVVQGPTRDQITLVGGGDPSLTAQPKPETPYPAPARLPDRAAATAARLREAGVSAVRLTYDDSLFTGPQVSPEWDDGYTVANVAPVTALMVDQGRRQPGERLRRSGDLAESAAKTFAGLLAQHGIRVTSTSRGPAAAGAPTLAGVHSPPVSGLVEHMLSASDNDYAEALARHVARAKGEEASFAGAVRAIRAVLGELGVPTAGLTLYDASGLSRQDRVSAETLARTLALAASPDHPELRAAVTGLPVAGFTGTLDSRFGGEAASALGYVRAKTGTLTGVNSLTGLVRDASGRLVVFAFIADRVPAAYRDTLAPAALDEMAAAVARCGC